MLYFAERGTIGVVAFTMGISSGCSSQNSLLTGKQFALVSYMRDPLARFLDQLRLQLVPDCTPRAHVTILPPRPVQGSAIQAAKEIHSASRQFEPFSLRLGDVSLFPGSDVVYIEIADGREELFEMYRAMNSGVLSYHEAYPYCPHITLAQRIAPGEAETAFKVAAREWNAYQFSRSILIETLHFVESDEGKCWRDLSAIVLEPQPQLVGLFK